jgi:predicted Zn-dependent protease
MAERGIDFWFNFKMVFSGIGWALRKAFRETYLIPRPSSLHSADELMEIVADLTSEHGGTGAAFKYAHRALKLSPDHLAANRFMAGYYMSSGKYAEALPFAQLVAEHQPGSVYAHLSRGQVWMEQGRFQEALVEFEEVLVIFPISPEMREMKAKALTALGQYKASAAARLQTEDVPASPK